MLSSRILLLIGSFALLTPAVSGDSTHPCPLPLKFHCHSEKCIAKDQQCNGRDDCGDGSDELNCEEPCDDHNWWRCNDGVCVDSLFRCNGEVECPDKSDELHCSEDYMQAELLQTNCTESEFQCSDGQCIQATWVCNGEEECDDGSDEHHCLHMKFPCQGFMCDDETCIVKSWRCDGQVDCQDKSDERDCIPPYDKCNLNDGFFACKDNKTCILSQHLCDQKKDCPDNSDEGGECHVLTKNCQNLAPPCSHGCLDTPTGPTCICPPGLHLLNSTSCTDIDECFMRPPVCSQECVNTLGSYRCECRQGYSLMKDNRNCRSLEEEPVMVFTTGNHIRAYYLEKEKYYSISEKAYNAAGVAYDGQYVYWTQMAQGNEGIMKASVNGSNKQVIVNTGISEPEDISVDWLTGNIYFTDSDFNHIAVCSSDGLHCTIIISRSLGNPRAVAVHSNLGILFWTDWESPGAHIGTANMDGSEDKKIITQNTRWPNGLSIDFQESRIYWVDGHFSKIESANFDGTDRNTVLENVHHPYWIDVFGDTVYWSDWVKRSIESCNKETGKDRQTLVSSDKVHGLQVYYPGRWNRTNDHSCKNTKCQLCLLKGTDSYSCACPVGTELARDGFSCISVSHPHLLVLAGGPLFITVNHQALGKHNIVVKSMPFREVNAITYDSLNDRIFVYDDYKKTIYSVDKYREERSAVKILVDSDIGQIEDMEYDYMTNNLYWCDTYGGIIVVMNLVTRHRAVVLQNTNSGDVPIELALVPEHGYMFIAFRTSENTIHIARMGMDGREQAVVVDHGFTGPTIEMHYDHLSEDIFISDSGSYKIERLHYTGHSMRLFRDVQGEPVSLTTTQNNVFWTSLHSGRLYWTDKVDYSDRVNRRVKMELPEIPLGLHITSTMEITMSKVHECFVHSEIEHDSSTYPCSHICVQRDNSGYGFVSGDRSTHDTHRCLCPDGLVLGLDMKTCMEYANCTDQHYYCRHSNVCIDKKKKCDGVSDCEYNEDEFGCTGGSSNCTHYEFQCKNKQCLDRDLVCDGHGDCSDNSDEDGCEASMCSSDEFICASGHCLDRRQECDGHPDCPGEEDEKDCEKNQCKDTEFRCASSACIPKIWECDQMLDCDDGSDEHNRCAYRKACSSNSFRCSNGRCINLSARCDGVDDCMDLSDEIHCPKRVNNSSTIKDGCDDEEYACYTKPDVCLSLDARCDGKQDCPRGEDELGCHPCAHDQWECSWKENIQLITAKWHGQCIPHEWLCDGSQDCMDGSDEDKEMCDERQKNPLAGRHGAVISHNENCKGGYRCRTGECVDYNMVCNGEGNCLDSSDEGGLCKKSCLSSNICSQKCQPSPQGGICLCNHGFVLAPDGKTCNPAPLPCSLDPCSHLCQNAPNNTYICHCYPGYKLKRDKVSCKAVGGPMAIIYVTGDTIKKFYPYNDTVTMVHNETNGRITGLDVDSAASTVIFSIKSMGEIHIMNKNSGDGSVLSNMGSPTLVSFDWISHNIYFVENASKINVCHMSRQACATIVSDTSGEITAMSVDPINKLLFYCKTKWSHDNRTSSYLHVASLHAEEDSIVYNVVLNYCTSMEIDYNTEKMFIVDQGDDSVVLVDYRKSFEHRKFFENEKMNIKFLQIFEDQMIFVHGESNSLSHFKIVPSKSYHMDLHGIMTMGHDDNITFIRIDQINRQKRIKDDCSNISCSNICLMSQCICPDGKIEESGKPCNGSNEIQGLFSTISRNSKNAVRSSSSGKTVAAVVIIITLMIIMLGAYVYIKKYKMKKGFNDSFKVHFSPPSLSAFIAPLNNVGSAANKLISSRIIRKPAEKGGEYENPLHFVPWLKNKPDVTVDVARSQDPSLLQIPNLLMDTDSDVESDRDLHDGDFREKTLLLP